MTSWTIQLKELKDILNYLTTSRSLLAISFFLLFLLIIPRYPSFFDGLFVLDKKINRDILIYATLFVTSILSARFFCFVTRHVSSYIQKLRERQRIAKRWKELPSRPKSILIAVGKEGRQFKSFAIDHLQMDEDIRYLVYKNWLVLLGQARIVLPFGAIIWDCAINDRLWNHPDFKEWCDSDESTSSK